MPGPTHEPTLYARAGCVMRGGFSSIRNGREERGKGVSARSTMALEP